MKNKIIVFYTPGKKYIETVLEKIKEAAKNNNYSVSVYKKEKEELKEFDFGIAVGGDGTFLWAASIVCKFNLPILGINLGNLGFLTDIKKEEIDKVFLYLKDKNYYIQERSLLKANFKGKEEIALNDCVFSSKDIRVINLDIFIDDEFVTQISGDGLIIATPTGSTAYSLSSGGPILKPDVEAFVITPISPHTLTFRPIVVSWKSRILVKVKRSCNFICDGQRLFNLDEDEEVLIRKNESPLKVVKIKDWKYFSILREKLNWGNK
ncbi:MAG: NAD(+)/NADH kinase [candidate division WOR-3 bacterium]